MTKELSTTIDAARLGGQILKKYFESSLRVEEKDDASFVTQADTESEQAIRTHLLSIFPNHSILGEEEGADERNSPYRWVIDPLDGTTNFINGLPLFAVSVALQQNNEIITAAIYNPSTDSLFSAQKDRGAFWNGHPMHVSNQKDHGAMITMGRSRKDDDIQEAPKLIPHLQNKAKYVRILGSAALEMAYLARGGTEGYINLGTKLWDYAAGTLLITEAGGSITSLSGDTWDSSEQYFVASNGHIHNTLISLTKNLPQAHHE